MTVINRLLSSFCGEKRPRIILDRCMYARKQPKLARFLAKKPSFSGGTLWTIIIYRVFFWTLDSASRYLANDQVLDGLLYSSTLAMLHYRTNGLGAAQLCILRAFLPDSVYVGAFHVVLEMKFPQKKLCL